MMKKQIIACIIAVTAAVQAWSINENVAVWEEIYNNVSSTEQRVSVLLRVMDFKDREFTPFLISALDEVVASRFDSGTTAEKLGKVEIARYLVQELGNLKSTEAAETVHTVYVEAPDPLLKAEAAISLGMMRAVEYAERLAIDLSAINAAPLASDAKNKEIIALGLVKALDAMRSPLGYEPVFHAASGWYTSVSGIKDAAKAALVSMVDDPSDNLLKIMSENPSLEVKRAALEAILVSKAPDSRKAELARKALVIGIERKADTIAAATAAAALRTSAINALSTLKDSSPESVPPLSVVVMADVEKKTDATLDEAARAYVALGVNGSDAAAEFLASRLAFYNDKELSKANTARDKLIIRQIIASMVTSKNAKVKKSLEQGKFITNYDNSIIKLMEDALKAIP